MSDQQKIWFIYLTDHHEGPFTAEEIAAMSKAGQVSGASLAWKDGMPEWVPAETIPELGAAIGNAAAVAEVAAADMSGVSKTGNIIQAPADQGSSLSISGDSGKIEAPAAPAGDGEVSLAQLLAQQQQGGGGATQVTAGTASGQISDSASVLSSMLGQVQKDNPVTSGSGVSIGGITQQTKSIAGDPPPDEEAWTLKIGAQVSGMHSLNRLKELASAGEIPPDAMVWHPGWSDFQPVSSVASIDSARKSGGTKTGVTRSSLSRPGFVNSGMSNSAAAGNDDDEPTDTGIEAPPPGGFKGLLFKVKAFAQKLKKKKGAKAAAPAPLKGGKVALAPVPAPGKKAGAAARTGGAVKRLVSIVLLVLVLAGAGAGVWLLVLQGPLPSDLDVSEDDKAVMSEAAKTKPDAGMKLVLAQSIGTEDSPADPTTPKYYVATNLAEGAAVTLTVTGVPGTLVNRVSFEKSFTANVEKTHLAVFDKISDEGKPLWGEFMLKVSAEGAEPVEIKKFIGNRGGTYQSRLKAFKDNVQSEYDKEIDELRQFITTLKAEQADASRLIKEYKDGWATATLRTKIISDWTAYTSKAGNFLGAIEQKLKERLGGTAQPKHHARAFQDVSTTVSQLQQLIKTHGDRISGANPGANADELDGLVQAGVQALELWLAGAVSKNPFDASKPAAPPTQATPPATTTPPAQATPPAATTPPAAATGTTSPPAAATTTTTPAPAPATGTTPAPANP